jgi:NAD(P)H-nitrite reductase large subunit
MKIVIIGNGPAAVSAAETVRQIDGACEIVMISKEDAPLYSPCPLAEYVEGTVPRANLFLRDRAFYASNRIETLFGCGVTRIDTAARRVDYAGPKGAGSVEYGRLLIATGADAILPPIHGLTVPGKSPGMFARMFGAQPAAGSKRQMLNPTPGLFTLKTIADADGIVSGIEKHRRAVVIGSGFIGLEAAQALARRGIEVTVAEALGHVLPQMLDEEVAERVGKRLADHGVKVLVNSPAQTIWWSRGGVHGVRAGSQELPCDIVICAAGVRPGLSYLEGSGIATARGIQVDSRMKTNQPDIYAAGDVIELDGKFLPNWPNAVKTGLIAGLNMMGQERSHAGLEDFNVVRIFDVPVASFGAREGDYQLRWESPGTLRKIAVTDGKVAGVQLWGDVNGMGFYHELMKKGADISAFGGVLASPQSGYGALLRPARLAGAAGR